MNLLAVSCLGGLLWLFSLPSLSPVTLGCALSVLLLSILTVLVDPQRRTALAATVISGIAAGVLLGGWASIGQLNDRLPTALEGQDIRVTASIVGLPVTRGRVTRFKADVINAGSARVPRRILLNWYGQAPALIPGEFWQFTVRLKRPHGLSNPGGFDYAGWLFQQRTGATGYVRDPETASRLLLLPRWRSAGHRWRLRVDSRLALAANDLQHVALMRALLIGARDQLAPEHYQLLRDTGTSHLLAISGLHIGLAAMWAGLVGLFAGRLLVLVGIRINCRDLAACCAIAGALIYSVLAGFTVPTQRALIMVLFALGCFLRRRSAARWSVWSGAVLVIICLDPLAPLSAGFWLSFGAVGSLIYLSQKRWLHRPPGWLAMWRIQLLLSVLLLPLTAISFAQVSLISPLANAIAIPTMSFIIVPILLLWLVLVTALPDTFSGMLWMADTILDLLLELLHTLSSLPLASLPVVPQPPLASAGLLIGAFVGTLPGVRNRLLATALVVPYLSGQLVMPADQRLRIDVLDVGQGLSVVVRKGRNTMLYDTGGWLGSRRTMAESVLVPYLNAEGISRLDKVVVSHSDSDHAAGVDYLRAHNWLPDDALGPAKLSLTNCVNGQRWMWQQVEFKILHPQPGFAGSNNDRSCVLRIRYGAVKILIPGDIELAGELAVVDTLQQEKSVLRDAAARAPSPFDRILRKRLALLEQPYSLLVAPHHGSQTSSSEPLLDALRPKQVVYSAGYRNRFGFPHASVQMRYKIRGVREFLTSRDGALRFRYSPNGLIDRPERYRESAKRLWHDKIW